MWKSILVAVLDLLVYLVPLALSKRKLLKHAEQIQVGPIKEGDLSLSLKKAFDQLELELASSEADKR